MAAVAPVALHIISGELQRAGQHLVALVPMAEQRSPRVVAAVLDKDPQGQGLGLPDQCLQVVAAAHRHKGAHARKHLAEQVRGGQIDFDLCIATPDAMRVVGQLGQILGPRGLMPNPKVGTVTMDVATAVKNAKAGQVQYRTDKAGIVHATVGRASFSVDALTQNCKALIEALVKARPAAAKGVYLRKISVSSTMGAGVRVDAVAVAAESTAA